MEATVSAGIGVSGPEKVGDALQLIRKKATTIKGMVLLGMRHILRRIIVKLLCLDRAAGDALDVIAHAKKKQDDQGNGGHRVSGHARAPVGDAKL